MNGNLLLQQQRKRFHVVLQEGEEARQNKWITMSLFWHPDLTLQGKDPLAEVIKEVFRVIKLAKIVKKTYASTSVSGNGGFDGAFNGNSTQLKKNGWSEVIMDVFFIGALIMI